MNQNQYLVVDGHSVIFHWEDLCRLHAKDQKKARNTLIHALRALHDSSHWLVTLVFDGKKGGKDLVVEGEMVVIYSQSGQTADSIIERLVGQVQDPSQVVVVTADEAERQMVLSMGAFSYSPDWLKQEMEREEEKMSEILEKIHRKAKW